jgi:hypothetical protein
LRAVRDRANNAALTEAINAYDQRLAGLTGQSGGGRGGRGRGGASAGGPTLASMSGELLSMLSIIEDSDAPPTTQTTAAVSSVQRGFTELLARWNTIRTTELASLNAKLRAAGQQAITISP